MPRRLESPRYRRRLAWATVIVAVPASLAVAAVLVGNTGRRPPEAPLSAGTAWTYTEPTAHRLTAAERREVVAAMTRFVRTAVARKHLDVAWRLVGPELRGGLTRKEWESGNNPVIPYRSVGISQISVAYSYAGDVGLYVSLIGERSEDAIAKTFTIELVRPRHDGRGRWLVSSWVPLGVSSPEVSRSARATEKPLPPVKAAVSTRWLFLPFAGLGSLLLLLGVGLGVRGIVSRRRAQRRYAEELAGYRSTARPS